MADLGSFGLAIWGYFSYLYGLIFVSFFMTAVNLPSMIYFESAEYRTSSGAVPFFLQGSAMCESTETVVITMQNGSTQNAEQNVCPFTPRLGYTSGISLLMLWVITMGFSWVLEQRAEKMDAAQQTAKDYALTVHDPDPNANDPEEWFDYFAHFGEVASITVVLKNGKLMKALAKRRLLKMLSRLDTTKEVENKDNGKSAFLESRDATWIKVEANKANAAEVYDSMGFSKSQKQWYQEWTANQEEISELYQRKFPVAKVVCIFEDEATQRKCLTEMTTGIIPALLDWKGHTKHLFRGNNALFVSEAPEPSDIIW
jgi:hypothetical protein